MRIRAAQALVGALGEDPHAGSPAAPWVDRLAAGAAAIATTLTGLVSWIIASGGGFDRIGRISPQVAIIALALGALGILTAIFGAFIRHRGDDASARRGRTLWFGWAACLMVIAFLVGMLSAIVTVRSRQQPDVSVKFDAGVIHAEVAAGPLTDSQRLSVALIGYGPNGPQPLYQGQIGPKADGSVTVVIDVPIATESYRHAAVVAYTANQNGFSLSDLLPRPSATPTEPATQSKPQPSEAANPNANLAASCWDTRGPIDYAYFACAEVELASGVTAPRVTIATAGAKAARTATVKLTSTLFPWRSLFLTVTDSISRKVLYGGRLAPDAVGSVDATATFVIGSQARRLCVVAVPDWIAATKEERACNRAPPIDDVSVGSASVGWTVLAVPASK
jgi:hypothetical protein